jgi:hypothetical protein
MPWARLLADLIVVLHAAYASFIVCGLVAILIGIVFRWGWVRNFWFRAIHLTMIGIVVAEEFVGMSCPLTDWEKRLRRTAGQAGYAGDFIGHWAHRLIFYDAKPWVFTVIYVLFGLAVLGTFIVAPPRWPARPRVQTPSASVADEAARSG